MLDALKLHKDIVKNDTITLGLEQISIGHNEYPLKIMHICILCQCISNSVVLRKAFVISMKGTERHFFHDNITNMGEVRACVYFSVIFLCFQISSAKVGI